MSEQEEAEGKLGGIFLLVMGVLVLVIACSAVVGARALVHIDHAVQTCLPTGMR